MNLDSPGENNNDDLAGISRDLMADNCTSLASLPAEAADNSLLNSEGKKL